MFCVCDSEWVNLWGPGAWREAVSVFFSDLHQVERPLKLIGTDELGIWDGRAYNDGSAKYGG